ncbi:MAG: hypothetical protein M5U28_34650 [Sandaracinaceae bacterium]|nr:hypothetical protein [Sandaracinaceae bacterium]
MKELGYEKLIVRAEVRPGRASEARYDLQPNARSQLIVGAQAQANIRGELGETRAGDAIRSLGNTLTTAQVSSECCVRPLAARCTCSCSSTTCTRACCRHGRRPR